MTITLQAVNELIASLESAGELSIREQKFLKLAKEFRICSASLDAAIKTGNVLADQNAQLAAENVEAKKIISECREYFIAGVMNRIRPMNEGYLHMICDTFADETPATERVVAGIKADGVEEFIGLLQQHVDEGDFVGDEVAVIVGAIDCGKEFFEQLHEGADK
ncbi:hypothetical protein U4L13_07595 [Klebsiella pneumoniae]|uniref:hypothetical protein n=1 Tax=Klebsiella pneumoniae TaxID=573 RepID=UPI000E2B1805|nr:hypothetical protein [Klebsiella pneumoniae]MCK9838466.1 hypothetical protein [Klebsiella pneumoniae]MDZ5881402.1 hypothetical protein [Klebsiella pneumoniae]MDZ5888809.1 hypothetical protein [Klebsiella pneumoniae]MDZ5897102.1 hypothetical protein [Klebsiella pneumoniae]MDZ5919554.1 hypothetical protein [Klebsiella pneumoniae]